jgi:hypothetical protein
VIKVYKRPILSYEYEREYLDFIGRIRGDFLGGGVFIYPELPERPVVFGCFYSGGRGVGVECGGGGGGGGGGE